MINLLLRIFKCEPSKPVQRRSKPKSKRIRKTSEKKLKSWMVQKIREKSACFVCRRTKGNKSGITFRHRMSAKKVNSISNLVKGNASWTVILNELKKCDPICTRCKPRVPSTTACKDDKKWMVNQIRDNALCACGSRTSLTFHHRDRSKKLAGVSGLVMIKASWGGILNELKKCDIVCRSCHDNIHKKEQREMELVSA